MSKCLAAGGRPPAHVGKRRGSGKLEEVLENTEPKQPAEPGEALPATGASVLSGMVESRMETCPPCWGPSPAALR